MYAYLVTHSDRLYPIAKYRRIDKNWEFFQRTDSSRLGLIICASIVLKKVLKNTCVRAHFKIQCVIFSKRGRVVCQPGGVMLVVGIHFVGVFKARRGHVFALIAAPSRPRVTPHSHVRVSVSAGGTASTSCQ